MIVVLFSVIAEIILPDRASNYYPKHWAHSKTH